MFPKDLPFFNNKAVVFGISAAFQEIVQAFELSFFDQNKDVVLEEFESAILPFIGDNSPDEIVQKMSALYDLGYLPLRVKSLPEGSMVGPNIPMLTIVNTHPDFAWLPNYLETFISSQIWKLSTNATIAKVYKNIFDYFAKKTGTAPEFALFQGHDFSCRGYEFPEVIDLLYRASMLNLTLVCYTGNEDTEFVMNYCMKNKIRVDYMNESPIKSVSRPHKPYFSILLDDRAGLASAVEALHYVIYEIEKLKELQND